MRPVEALIAYTRSCRASSIAVTTWPEEATRTANSGCAWIAVATVEGGIYTARSRHGVANGITRNMPLRPADRFRAGWQLRSGGS
jgi:hypothetical protein